ncbi:hypothetical protein ACU4GD_39875 [Cupriavidus basilensis]
MAVAPPAGGPGQTVTQQLLLIERRNRHRFHRTALEAVFFVPLKSGTISSRTMHNIVNTERIARAGQLATASLLLALLAACASSPMPAPVVDRTSGAGVAGVVPLEPAPPGYYRVKRGDTLYRIALGERHLIPCTRCRARPGIRSPRVRIGIGGGVEHCCRVVPPGADVNAGTGVATGGVLRGANGSGVQAQPDRPGLRPAPRPIPVDCRRWRGFHALPAPASAAAADGTIKLARLRSPAS